VDEGGWGRCWFCVVRGCYVGEAGGGKGQRAGQQPEGISYTHKQSRPSLLVEAEALAAAVVSCWLLLLMMMRPGCTGHGCGAASLLLEHCCVLAAPHTAQPHTAFAAQLQARCWHDGACTNMLSASFPSPTPLCCVLCCLISSDPSVEKSPG